MATSGSTVWELTRDNIISAALRKIGVLGKGESPDSTDLESGQMALNGIISRYNTLGMPLWKRTEKTISIVTSTTTYSMTGTLKLNEVYLRSTTGTTQYKLERKSLYDLRNMPYGTTGVPVCWCFTPTRTEGGTLVIWPEPTSSEATNYSLRAIVQDELDTFTSATETPDFPAYWTDALVYELASNLAPEYGVPLNDRNMLQKQAMQFLGQAQSYGDDDGSITFVPERRW